MELIATNSFRAWIKACRVQTLGATLCPIMLGSAFAGAEHIVQPMYFWLTLITAMLLQILANVVNDYGDFLKGSDTALRLGPPRAMQMGWIEKRIMERGIVFIGACIIFLGLILVMRGGVAILLAGSLGLIVCCWYSLGPRPLAYIGFVEVLIFFIFGPGEVLGAYYIQSLSWSKEALIISLTPGFLACALNLTNNLRDIDQDRLHHKCTIAVRYGEQFARYAIVVLMALSLLGPLLLVAIYGYSWWLLFSCLALLPCLSHISMILFEPICGRFNRMLKSLGMALYLFGFLASLGIIYGAP